MLLRQDLLRKYLKDKGLAFCWTIIGEKWVVGGDATTKYYGRATMSGAYSYTDKGLDGFLHYRKDLPDSDDRDSLEGSIDKSEALDSEVVE